jgi:GT2 family glycosyltransferase
MNKEVTLVITSCGRFDLLKQTLISFFKFNTYPITECIIIDDSGTGTSLDFLKEHIPVPVKFIINDQNIGQIRSIDKAYTAVATPYIFHCEDDWEFFKPGFIEESFKILDVDLSVITVWLRSHNDTMGHPINYEIIKNSTVEYYYLEYNYKGKWHGFTLNPGLRRSSDCMKFHPYDNLDVKIPKKKKWILGEVDLSIYYYDAGYRGAITKDVDGYVRHTGWKHHIPLPWETK